eukprot:108875-Chlamydomonas_euryale.AAC.1
MQTYPTCALFSVRLLPLQGAAANTEVARGAAAKADVPRGAAEQAEVPSAPTRYRACHRRPHGWQSTRPTSACKTGPAYPTAQHLPSSRKASRSPAHPSTRKGSQLPHCPTFLSHRNASSYPAPRTGGAPRGGRHPPRGPRRRGRTMARAAPRRRRPRRR